MNSIDFIKVPMRVLATVGFQKSSESTGCDVYQIYPNFIFYATCINTLIHVIGQSNGAFIHIGAGSLPVTAHYIFPIFFGMSAASKALLILIQRQRLNDLLIDLDEILPRTQQQLADYRFKICLNRFQRLAIIYVVIQIISLQYISWSSIVITCLSPKNDTNETMHIPLPYGDEYPFYKHSTISFIVMFCSQIWQAYFCTAMITSLNLILCGNISQILMHYEHLCRELKRSLLSERENSESIHLVWCISKHNQLNG